MVLKCNLQWEWKLLVVLLLCSTYRKWETPHEVKAEDSGGQHLLHAALEWHFYKLFLMSILGLFYYDSISFFRILFLQ